MSYACITKGILLKIGSARLLVGSFCLLTRNIYKSLQTKIAPNVHLKPICFKINKQDYLTHYKRRQGILIPLSMK